MIMITTIITIIIIISTIMIIIIIIIITFRPVDVKLIPMERNIFPVVTQK